MGNTYGLEKKSLKDLSAIRHAIHVLISHGVMKEEVGKTVDKVFEDKGKEQIPDWGLLLKRA